MLERLTRPEGVLAMPEGPPVAAALVLSGLSGGVEEERCRLLASYGIAALSIRWFGGTGQSPGICEVPLEIFGSALDRLATLAPRLSVIGVSKGAEAGLLLAAHNSRISLTVAMSPSSVVWANVGAGRDGQTTPHRSSWSWQGAPLAFVPFDDTWQPPHGDWPSHFGRYKQSLTTFADRVPTSRIPVERISGDVIVTAGGDDQVWPSDAFATAIVERRRQAGLDTVLVAHPGAGNRPTLPGEPASFSHALARGGTPAADAQHGAAIWSATAKSLGL